MLGDRERQALGEIENRIAAEDPGFADALRDGQERLPAPGGGVEHMLLAPMVLLVIILLLSGQLTTAVIVASIAAGAGWLTSARPGPGARR